MNRCRSRTSRTNARGMLLVFAFMLSASVRADDCDFCQCQSPAEFDELVSCRVRATVASRTIEVGDTQSPGPSVGCGNCASPEPQKLPVTFDLTITDTKIRCVSGNVGIVIDATNWLKITGQVGYQQCIQLAGFIIHVSQTCETIGCEEKVVRLLKKPLTLKYQVELGWSAVIYCRDPDASPDARFLHFCNRTDTEQVAQESLQIEVKKENIPCGNEVVLCICEQ